MNKKPKTEKHFLSDFIYIEMSKPALKKKLTLQTNTHNMTSLHDT